MSPINSTTQYSSKQQNSSFPNSKLLLSSSRLRPQRAHPIQIGWTPLISVTASSLVIVSSLLIAASSSFSSSSSYLVDAYPVMMSPNELLRKHNPVMAIEIDNPEEVLSVLDNLIQSILVGIDYQHQQHGSPYNQNNGGLGNNNNQNMLNQNQNLNNIDKSLGSKRGIDLGLSRGFSGNQAAKHLMGMSAASFANGPGRRR